VVGPSSEEGLISRRSLVRATRENENYRQEEEKHSFMSFDDEYSNWSRGRVSFDLGGRDGGGRFKWEGEGR
jgi:hypothetical protein